MEVKRGLNVNIAFFTIQPLPLTYIRKIDICRVKSNCFVIYKEE